MLTVDLHVHSNRSDGSFSPTQLVDYACEKGLAAFALTDHDTIDGLEEAIRYAQELREEQNQAACAPAEASQDRGLQAAKRRAPEVIPGIEFSTEYMGQDVHVVGLYIDYRNQDFTGQLSPQNGLLMCTQSEQFICSQ